MRESAKDLSSADPVLGDVDLGWPGVSLSRWELDNTTHMHARAGAIDELMASDALDDVNGLPLEDIHTELDRMAGGTNIEAELERLKDELSGGLADQMKSGTGTSSTDAAGQARRAEQPEAGEGS